MSGCWFGQHFRDKGDVPHYFHDTDATMMIQKFYAKLVMHAPMWTLKHQVLCSCDTRAQDSFFLFKSTQCFQNMLIYQFHAFIRVYFGCSGKFSHHSPFRCKHIFLKNLCLLIGDSFQRKVEVYFFSKACWLLVNQFYFLFLFVLFVFLLRPFFKKIKNSS